MQLSKNFSLDEMMRSAIAARHGIDNQPTQEQLERLERLCKLVLQPIRDQLGVPIFVSSGYRSFKVNQIAKGSRHSDHMTGSAADISAVGYSAPQLARFITAMMGDLPIKQLILEFPPNGWVHVSVAPDDYEPRRDVLTAKLVEGETVYVSGLA
jgi:hypothetical protein